MNPDGTAGNVRMYYLRAGVQHRVPHLSAAPHLVAVADHVAREWEGQYDAWPLTAGWPSSVPHRRPRVFVGTVASADRWNRSSERIRELAQKHGSLCEDMEAAAIALTCASHDVPFLTIKDISNNELLRMTDERFDAETEGQLGRRAAMLTLATMRTLVAQQQLTDAHGNR
jgi:nucleoside phosphorylase